MDIRIALAGNPNSGKTTLFNALTGSNQFVGNWPGVTVEKKEGRLRFREGVTVTDLPGIYSLSPYTPEEVVARRYLAEERPDAILNIVDGTNLERNLYLTTQLTELGIPLVVAVNMMDAVEKSGDRIDSAALTKRLGCPVVEISALKGRGVAEAAEAAVAAAREGKAPPPFPYSGAVEHALAHIEEAAVHHLPGAQQRWYAVKLFERDQRVQEALGLTAEQIAHIETDIAAVEEAMDDDAESIITAERYGCITGWMSECCRKSAPGALSLSDRIDRVVTHRLWGLPIFAVVMFLVYSVSMMGVGAAATDWANESLFGEGFYLFGLENCWVSGVPVWFERLLDALHVADIGVGAVIRGVVLDGIVAGVGAVLGFVPQMLVLFFMLAFLEACGYMARIAFVLDRVFRKFGLSGKSFIPMLIGTGCGIPGIMASRTIENERDRRMTVMTTTFIPCGAKVPFIAMIAGAIFHGGAWVTTLAYFTGMAAIIVSGIILKKTRLFAGDVAPFVMELPAYRLPTLPNLLRSAWERGWSFIRKAGTIILLSTVLVWFASSFGFTGEGFRMLAEEELHLSLLSALGSAVCGLFAPLGWGNWQAVVASVTGLIAKENIVSTMGVLYGGEGNVYAALAESFTAASALSFLVFNLLCAPCFAAIGAIRREMNSARWTWFAVGYQCVFAYAVALMVYQFGCLLTTGAHPLGLAAAGSVLAGLLCLLLRPAKRAGRKEGEDAAMAA